MKTSYRKLLEQIQWMHNRAVLGQIPDPSTVTSSLIEFSKGLEEDRELVDQNRSLILRVLALKEELAHYQDEPTWRGAYTKLREDYHELQRTVNFLKKSLASAENA